MKFTLKYSLAFIFVLLTLSLKSWSAANPDDTDPLLAEANVYPYEWSPGQGGNLEIKMNLPEGYHAYEDQFRVVILEPDGFKVAPLKIEPLTKWFDRFSKKERFGVEKQATLKAHIEAPNRFLKKHTNLKLEFIYQACSDQFCLFPTTKTIDIPITVTMVEGEPQIHEKETVPVITTSLFDAGKIQQLMGTNIFIGLLLVFIAGIFTSFTPCIFPMIPITLAVLGNHSQEKTRLQNFITSCLYVLGIATTYSIMGLVAASTGSVFGSSLGNPYVLTVVCLIFLTMALSMYGLFEIQVPAAVRNRFGAGKHKNSLGGAYLTGLFAGIVASPCVGPVLVTILTYVASTQNKILGFLYLFSYAIGLGLIFIVLGLSNQLLKALPRSGVWMNGFKFILGSLMLGAFYYYLQMLLPVRWFDFVLSLGLISIASIYGAFLTAKDKSAFNHIRKGMMQAVLIIGFGYAALAAFDLRPYIHGRIMANGNLNQIQKLNWQPYSESLLAEAAKNKKPVIIDFWADWCAACHELEEYTFTDARVRAIGENFVLLKFDATKDTEQLRVLKKKYNIQGLPTVLFFNPNGVWIDALTLTQFEKSDSFLKRMEKTLR